MKNVHLIPTNKPSKLYKNINDELSFTSIEFTQKNGFNINQNIYITNDEEIKKGDWFLTKTSDVLKVQKPEKGYDPIGKKIILTTDDDLIIDGVQAIDDEFLEWYIKNPSCEEVEVKKICNNCGNIDCIHAICKSQIAKTKGITYKIIIPKEEPNKTHYLDELPNMDRGVLAKMWESAIPKLEPKQETLEEDFESYELAEKLFEEIYGYKAEIIKGNLQHEVQVAALQKGMVYGSKWQAKRDYSEEELRNAYRWGTTVNQGTKEHFNELLEQFKKK